MDKLKVDIIQKAVAQTQTENEESNQKEYSMKVSTIIGKCIIMFHKHKYKYYQQDTYFFGLEALPMNGDMRKCRRRKCGKIQIKQPNLSWFALHGLCKTYKWETI